MAQFDRAQRLDDPRRRFDQISVAPVASKHPRLMSLFKLELRSKSPSEKVALGNTHIAAMAEPEAITNFPIANRLPLDADYAATVALVDTTNQAADAAEIAWKQANAARDAAVATFDLQTTARMNYCEAAQP